MPIGNKFVRNYWAALLWAAFILLLCGIPGNDLPNIDFWALNIEDKLAHIGIFFILGALMVYGHYRTENGFRQSGRTLFAMIGLGVFYGALTEVLQHFVFVARFASLADFLADTLGALFGTVFAFLWFKKQKSR